MLTIDSKHVILNGRLITNALDVAPIIINDRTFLPIRYIAEALHGTVNWDETSQTVTIGFYTPS